MLYPYLLLSSIGGYDYGLISFYLLNYDTFFIQLFADITIHTYIHIYIYIHTHTHIYIYLASRDRYFVKVVVPYLYWPDIHLTYL